MQLSQQNIIINNIKGFRQVDVVSKQISRIVYGNTCIILEPQDYIYCIRILLIKLGMQLIQALWLQRDKLILTGKREF